MEQVKKPAARWELALMIGGAILSAVILQYGFAGERKFDEAALGDLTVGYEARLENGKSIHTVKQRPEEIADMLSVAHNGRPNVFVLGNSQTHSINQIKEGDRNYPEILSSNHPEVNVLTHSIPNANLQEFLTLYAWWKEQIPIQQLLVPVFMDDLREEGLRADFIPAILASDFQLLPCRDDLLSAKINGQILALRLPQQTSDASASESKATPQDRVEAALNDWISARSEVWQDRPNARGDFFLQLYQWRNKIFGIDATTKRKIIPTRYSENLSALECLLQVAQAAGTQVVLYIPPIRNDVEVPYDLDEYSRFKAQVESLGLSFSNVQFLNLEDVVPGALWGMKASTTSSGEPELDFMHFQGKGHEILAGSLSQYLITGSER